MRTSALLACLALAACIEAASAQTVLDVGPVSQPVVTITAAATSNVVAARPTMGCRRAKCHIYTAQATA